MILIDFLEVALSFLRASDDRDLPLRFDWEGRSLLVDFLILAVRGQLLDLLMAD